MNIPSLNCFQSLMERAWHDKIGLVAHLKNIDTASITSIYPCVHDMKAQLSHIAAYYHHLQARSCAIVGFDYQAQYDHEQWISLKEWIEKHSDFICFFIGQPKAPEWIPKDSCVYYYNQLSLLSSYSDPDLDRIQNTEHPLREKLIQLLQSEARHAPYDSLEMIRYSLEEIAHQKIAFRDAAKMLWHFYEGMEGTLADKSALSRIVKWSIFEYLTAVKSAQKS